MHKKMFGKILLTFIVFILSLPLLVFAEDKDDMSKTEFSISVNKFLGENELKDGGKDGDGVAKSTINTVLGTVIQKLMIALGSISLLIMTIGAGYMIMYSGHDELLSKGKSIFNAGIISLIVALLSYYMVSLLKFILYS